MIPPRPTPKQQAAHAGADEVATMFVADGTDVVEDGRTAIPAGEIVKANALAKAAAQLGLSRDHCSYLYRELSAAVDWVRDRGVGGNAETIDPAEDIATAAVARMRSEGWHARPACQGSSVVLEPSMIRTLVGAYETILQAIGPGVASDAGREQLATMLLSYTKGHQGHLSPDGGASVRNAIEQLAGHCERCLQQGRPHARSCPWR